MSLGHKRVVPGEIPLAFNLTPVVGNVLNRFDRASTVVDMFPAAVEVNPIWWRPRRW